MSGCYPTNDNIDSLEDRIKRIEEILKDYLKPNTRDNLDRLEQRFRIIELKLRDLNVRID